MTKTTQTNYACKIRQEENEVILHWEEVAGMEVRIIQNGDAITVLPRGVRRLVVKDTEVALNAPIPSSDKNPWLV